MRKAKSKKTTSTQKQSQHKYFELADVWPQERDFMARPDRLKYVRKLLKPKACVFCEAWEKGVSEKSLVLYKNKYAMIIMNKFPYNTGHLMVIPDSHEADLSGLQEKHYLEVTKLIRKAVDALKYAYKPAGFNIGLNQGSVAGAGIPGHLHWHIIPRWAGDTNFFPLIAETKVLPESLEQTYKRLRKYFK